MASTFWDKAKATYRDSKGKEIAYDSVRSSIEKVADDARLKIRKLAESYNNKAITLSDFVTGAEPIIRKSLISSSMIASGGKEMMTPTLNGRLGNIVKYHLDRFKGFWLDIEKGNLTPAQILSRADLYGEIPVRVYEEMRKGMMVDAGYTMAENILGAARHCDECPSLSALGKVPIDEMPPPGSRQCMNRCRCRVVYS